MEENNDESLVGHLSVIPDPRIERSRRHNFLDILVIAVCAVICGAEGWTDIEDFGLSKEDWLRNFLELPSGIPSHDTFRRIFLILDPLIFQQVFMKWIGSVNKALFKKDIISIDGKTLRGSLDRANEKSALHMISAWSSNASVVIGQMKSDGKSNEITSVPELLKLLQLKGCIVTMDAMNCQKKTADQIVKQGADYLLCLKENHPDMRRNVEDRFKELEGKRKKTWPMDDYEIQEKGHGRLETRKHTVIYKRDEHGWGLIDLHGDWKNLNAILRIESERVNLQTGEIATESRYYITSMKDDAKTIAHAIREHWNIENKLHWRLDVLMREDECRVRAGNSAENFAVLRHLAFNLLKTEPTKKSLRRKQKTAGWDHGYLLQILFNNGKSKGF
jgi:predicted transposase YbfD/YdcC